MCIRDRVEGGGRMSYQNRIDLMTDVYEDYCKKEKLPLLDITDLLYGRDTKDILTSNQKQWLITFNDIWDRLEQ